MKLPNNDSAVIPRRKLTDYLLNEWHEEGRGKALFFEQFGYSINTWEALAAALTMHAQTHEVVKVEQTPFGTRYVIEGILDALDGRTPFVRVVWFIDRDSTVPRLVTAYPLEEKE
jgi:hypothetical protein